MNCHKSNFISQFGIDLRISKFMNFSGMFKNCWKLEPKIHVNSINLSLKNTNTLFICILVHRIIVKYSRSRDWNRFLRSWQLKQQTLQTAVPWACSEAVAMCHVVCEIICEIELIMNARWLVEECVRAGSQFMCRYLHRRRQRVTLMVTQTPRCSEVASLVRDTAWQNRLPFFLSYLTSPCPQTCQEPQCSGWASTPPSCCLLLFSFQSLMLFCSSLRILSCSSDW